MSFFGPTGFESLPSGRWRRGERNFRFYSAHLSAVFMTRAQKFTRKRFFFLKQCKFDGPETNLADVPIQWRDKSHYFAFWFCRRGAAAGGDTLLNWTTRCVARHAICFIWKWPKKKMPSSRFFVVKLPVSWWPTSTSANFRRLVISTVFFGCQSNMQISGSWKGRNTFFFWAECIFHRHRGRCEVEVPTARGEITQLNEKGFSLWVLNEALGTERNKRLNRPAVGGIRPSPGIHRFSRQVSTCWFNLLDKSTVKDTQEFQWQRSRH